VLATASVVAHSQGVFERLVMPGPLIAGHAKLEKDCNSCHQPFSPQSQAGLCLDCHKEVATDRASKRGFHGRQPEATKSDCKQCHTEHKGRQFDIVQLNRETFNHTFTDFALTGSHKRASCDGCHASGVKYRETNSRCFDCHKADDPHKGRLGETCQDCHNEQAWRQVKPFDHSKTRFKLIGAHAEVACRTCHLGEHYKGLSTSCISCHSLNDKHGGRYGAKCETCHAPSKWALIGFDHDKSTKFPLRGGHATVGCEGCHRGDLYRDKLSMACSSCHGKDDPHKGQLGKTCEKCHNETGWRQKVAFDHDLTRFPLIGLHAVVPCEGCHRSASFKDAPRVCASCHEDTHHVGRFGTNCASCHNPNGWSRWRFDHDKQTRFPLTGTHRALQCDGCHKQTNVARASAPRDCYGCHSQDDAHEGAFGRACEKCHNTSSFGQGRRR
jgi:hypothetical protein